jgi:hypothetical protein
LSQLENRIRRFNIMADEKDARDDENMGSDDTTNNAKAGDIKERIQDTVKKATGQQQKAGDKAPQIRFEADGPRDCFQVNLLNVPKNAKIYFVLGDEKLTDRAHYKDLATGKDFEHVTKETGIYKATLNLASDAYKNYKRITAVVNGRITQSRDLPEPAAKQNRLKATSPLPVVDGKITINGSEYPFDLETLSVTNQPEATGRDPRSLVGFRSSRPVAVYDAVTGDRLHAEELVERLNIEIDRSGWREIEIRVSGVLDVAISFSRFGERHSFILSYTMR